jgi:hypothetical protein
MASKEGFFSRSNVHMAVWSILLALLAFTAGRAWTFMRGTEKLVVATPADGAQPLVVRVERPPDDPAIEAVARMDALVSEVRRLQEQSERIPIVGGNDRRRSSSTTNRPFLPAFVLPSVVKGYHPASLSGFGEGTCPSKEIRAGDAALIHLELDPSVNLDELTPAFLRVVRPEGKQQAVQLFEEQYVLGKGRNAFRLPFDLRPGVYQVSVGFYARAELGREYPQFYAMSCEVAAR